VEFTPEMLLLVNAITSAYGTAQRNVALTQPQTQTTGEGTVRPFTGAAKTAMEKFNDIQAGLTLKPPLLPPTFKATLVNGTTVKLEWSVQQQEDNPYAFKVQRAPGDIDPFDDLVTVPASQKEHSDGPLTAKTKYRYRVISLTNRGEVASDPQSIVTP
jgi:hypothetical protein